MGVVLMAEKGLYKLGGLLFMALLAVAGLAYLTSGGRTQAEAAPGPRGAARTEAAAPAPVAALGAGAPPSDAVCAPDGAPRPLDDDLHESSGAAASRTHAGIVWTHNDSGDPLLHAVDADGRTVGRVRVAGAALEDWEDLALAPCPSGGDCLFVADIGDNDGERASVTVYRIPEPAPGASASARATALRLRYPDGAQDAEALFVLDGRIHIVTKGERGPVALYRAPADARGEATLRRVAMLSADRVDRDERITGADASADGRWVVLRTLREARLHSAAALVRGDGAGAHRIDLRELDERQGEGIAFTPDGSIVLTSEGGKKDQPATLSRLACTLP